MKREMTELIKSGIIVELSGYNNLVSGTIVRRIGGNKDQQGRFTRLDDSGGLILVNVVDISAGSFVSEAGIIRPVKGDSIYRYTTAFSNDMKSAEAIDILLTWSLYVKNPELQAPMEYFFTSTFSPEHILYLKKTDKLDAIFVPLQQKLKIGRYVESINWENVRRERFEAHLKGLKPGDHITYLALVPQTSSYRPKFYSIGTKPHEEVQLSLRAEAFNFKPTHGGHIKAARSDKGVIYYVDAGSSFIGKGIKTKLETAENVARALRREYREFRFIPLEGRGAFGTDQSY